MEPSPSVVNVGHSGGSLQAEYERRSAERKARARARFPRLDGSPSVCQITASERPGLTVSRSKYPQAQIRSLRVSTTQSAAVDFVE